MHKLLPLVLGSCALLAVGQAQAQTSFSIGPRVGLNVASAKYDYTSVYNFGFTTAAVYRPEAGLQANISRKHFALQPSLLYSQKGYVLNGGYERVVGGQTQFADFHETYSLKYLTVPVNFVYTQKGDGQGFQGFGGGYVGVLLGGKAAYDNAQGVVGATRNAYQFEQSIRAGNYYKDLDNFYSHRFDAGLQVGMGYRYQNTLLQAGYSIGLANLGAKFPTNPTNTESTEKRDYYNRTFQVSLTYLFDVTRPSSR